MQKLDRELFEEFKRVDAICKDMFSCQYGVSEYIDQMEQTPEYKWNRVPTWRRDHRSLKRVRWLRNQIAHEMTAADCTADDVEYLREFHDRLLRQQDPLAILGRTEREARRSPRRQPAVAQKNTSYTYTYSRGAQKPPRKRGGAIWGVIAAIILLACIVFYLSK